MKITFLSIFPSMFSSFLEYPVIKRAMKKGLVEIEVRDIREYTQGSFRDIDDSPYGGGAGLLIRADALKNALDSALTDKSRTILMGPKGRKFDQKMAHNLLDEDHIILIAGHYEGIDERFRSHIDDEISIGDYILTGGESAAIVVAEAVIRLLDGALREHSAEEESFEGSLLEYPQYTHPEVFEGVSVPDVLLTGNTEKIREYQELEAIKDTIRLRPDMLEHNQEFRYHIVHKNHGNESSSIRFLSSVMKVPEIMYEDYDYLVLKKPAGKKLSEAGRNKIIRICASVLKRLWSIDVREYPNDRSSAAVISEIRKKNLSYDNWNELKELENITVDEDIVFSHGNLTAESIWANGNGFTGLTDLQHSGKGDRYRDLSSILDSLESMGIDSTELLKILHIRIDRDRLDYYRRLRKLEFI